MFPFSKRPAANAIATFGLISLAVASPARAMAGDVAAGREKAQQCQTCHGLDGLAKIAEAPNLAGQNEQYLIKQLTAFKTGERQNEMMSIVAPALSDTDIENLAAYYSAIEISIGKVPGEQ